MKKLIALLSAAVMCAGIFASAVQAEPVQNTDISITVAAMQGPTGMGMAYLNKMSDEGSTEYRYDITYASSPDEIKGELINGSIDIAAIPVNLASVLFNKTEGQILTAAVNTLGVLYVVENGSTVNSIADLSGKKVLASGMGSTPEYIFNYLLEQNGMLDEVEVEYLAEHDAAVAALADGSADLILIPEPKVTAALSQVEGARIAINITEEWNSVYKRRASGTDSVIPELVQGVIVVQKAFAEEHPEAVDAFLAEYAESVEFTNSNMEEASQIIESYGIVPKAAIALKALPNCNIVCLTGEAMTSAVSEMLSVLFEADPQSVGGKLCGNEMFYIMQNNLRP